MASSSVAHTWERPACPGLLTAKELRQYWDWGYVIKQGVFSQQELAPVHAATCPLVDELAHQLYAAGKVRSLYEDTGLDTRLTALEAEFPGAAVLVHKTGHLPTAYRQLWSHSKLPGSCLETTSPGHPVWNLRSKTPQQPQANVPWHQDTAYLHPESWGMLQVTAWVQLVEATAHNSGLQVCSGGHRSGLTAKLYWGHLSCGDGHGRCAGASSWSAKVAAWVDFDRDIVTCAMKARSVLFMKPHRSTENLSSQIREMEGRLLRQTSSEGHPVYDLPEVEADSLQLVLQAVYGLEYEINQDNVEALLASSNYLAVDSVHSSCCDMAFIHRPPRGAWVLRMQTALQALPKGMLLDVLHSKAADFGSESDAFQVVLTWVANGDASRLEDLLEPQ
ncbi:hypothetical protein WJX72_005384 [[Myrmecia] bisecta]|uniref:BTB domain-containing protein n=1 Tax=[Myrmecia] bisecta TaxID=41462 RepID=A0AAW1PT42_9CHLO